MLAEFFDPFNEEFNEKRAEAAQEALDDMLNWLESGGDCHGSPSIVSPASQSARGSTGAGVGSPSCIALYDATNSTADRRRNVQSKCAAAGVRVFFIESICNDESIILKNIMEFKLSSPDYVDVSTEVAIQDFKARINNYSKVYETLSTNEFSDISFVKIVDIGKQITVHNISGYLESRIVYFLMNLNTSSKPFFISRHGESEFNLAGKIGGDSDLSERGRIFAGKLPEIFRKHADGMQLTVWTSTLKRTIQTASKLSAPTLEWKNLDELSSGSCDGMTYEEIEAKFPEDFKERDTDKCSEY